MFVAADVLDSLRQRSWRLFLHGPHIQYIALCYSCLDENQVCLRRGLQLERSCLLMEFLLIVMQTGAGLGLLESIRAARLLN
jgi:hypothetical protein